MSVSNVSISGGPQVYMDLKKTKRNPLRPSSIKLPPKSHPDELLQMTGDLDSSHIRRMPLWADIIVLHDARGVEVVHERLGPLAGLRCLLGHSVVYDRVSEVVVRAEPLVHLVDFVDETLGRVGEVGVAGLVESEPE